VSIDTTNATWRKATHSNPTGSCIEAGSISGLVLVRDTAQRVTGPVLKITLTDWKRFTRSIALSAPNWSI
jgi:hypothetical protein